MAWLPDFLFCIAAAIILLLLVLGMVMSISSRLQWSLIFMNHVRIPLFANLNCPSSLGILGVEHQFIQGPAGKIGLWVVSPEGDCQAVVVYMHGNTGSRGTQHRVKLYKVLSSLGFCVVAFDYRGYGDSEGSPSESGLVEDAMTVYRWVSERFPKMAILLHGHSLGSYVATRVASMLTSQKDLHVCGLVLESAFCSLKHGLMTSPKFKKLVNLPVLGHLFLKDISNSFVSKDWIGSVDFPILFLHDVSDHIISVCSGKELAAEARAKNRDVELVLLDEKLYHKFICTSENFPNIIRRFFDRCRQQ